MGKRTSRFTVVRGDDQCYFKYGKEYRQADVDRCIDHALRKIRSEVFPGLQLKDECGTVLEPEVTIVFKPANKY